MKYKESLSIIFMRDNGPRRSFRVCRGRFYAALVFFACLPVLSSVLGWHCWQLWQENAALRANVLRFESDYQGAQATAERLEHLEELLREEDVQGRDLVLRRLGGGEPAVEAPPADRDENGKSEALRGAEGPGHEDFPAIDLDYVKVGNVQVRALRGGKLRLALDLRNTDNQRLASGSVSGTLITADGAKHPLSFDPENVGDFRISRFKRTVIVVRLPGRLDLVNAQVILEVRNQDESVVYRNIFPVEH
ncbi:hypothetical protein [Desulfovibrio falkowii]|uniref:Uncharacterized protein n=2 Tax=Desulfovibrio TaxID=872 RepID=B8J223_DESDA